MWFMELFGMEVAQETQSDERRTEPSSAQEASAAARDDGGARETLDAQVPATELERRERMRAQRERVLRRRSRSPGPYAGAPMAVSASDTPVMPEGRRASPEGRRASPEAVRPGTSSSSRPGSAPLAGPGGEAAALADEGAGDFLAAGALFQRASSASAASRGSTPRSPHLESRTSRDEAADFTFAVGPEPMSEDDSERRRMSLRQDLDERGINQVFDPTAIGVASVASASPDAQEADFDIASIPPPEMRQFLLGPAPKHVGMIECRITRERCGVGKFFPKYILESDSGIFLLSAKKQKQNKTSNYTISTSQADIIQGNDGDSFVGKLRSNFLGLEFTAYGTGLNPKKIDPSMSKVHAIQLARQELVSVLYNSSLWGSKPRGPRKMSAVIPRVRPNGERIVCRTLTPETEGLLPTVKSSAANQLVDVFQNKPPKWNEQIGAFVLNFNKRVTQASVKNFQLTTSEDPDTVYLQFGRVGKDVFNMDFRHPFSPVQAFAICLSSFDYKLCCE